MLAFRRARQAAVVPVPDAIIIAAVMLRRRVATAEVITFPREMILFMAVLTAIVMAIATRAAVVIAALMVTAWTALRPLLLVSVLAAMARAILPDLLLPRTMAVIWAIGKSLSAQHAG